jgi:hypothetical protein
MTKEQLLHQIANIGYSTSYGRDKCYSTADIATKTTWRITILGVFVALLCVLYPILNNISVLAFGVIGLTILGIYLRPYTDNKYIESAQKLERIERQLQNLYFEVKANNETEPRLNVYGQKLEDLDDQQKTASISSQVLGSDWYTHVKLFWAKKINSQWFVDELKLKFFFDKLPFSFFCFCLLICILTLLIIIGFFIASHLIEQGQAQTYLEFFKGMCK